MVVIAYHLQWAQFWVVCWWVSGCGAEACSLGAVWIWVWWGSVYEHLGHPNSQSHHFLEDHCLFGKKEVYINLCFSRFFLKFWIMTHKNMDSKDMLHQWFLSITTISCWKQILDLCNTGWNVTLCVCLWSILQNEMTSASKDMLNEFGLRKIMDKRSDKREMWHWFKSVLKGH